MCIHMFFFLIRLQRCYTGFTCVWHNPPSFFHTVDSALDDFVVTHCIYIPNSQLCPVLMAQYPFRTTFAPRTKPDLLHFCPLALFWSFTAVHLSCPGLAGLWTGKDRLHAEQQAQGNPSGDAVGCCTRRPPAGRGRLSGFSRGFVAATSPMKWALVRF